jgi:hypothetical protein
VVSKLLNSIQHSESAVFERCEMIDRRERPRYSTKAGTFALLRATSIALSKIQDMSMGEIGFAVIKSKPVKMGQIINISTKGLAFDYIVRRGESTQVYKLDILFARDAFYLGKLLFKPVFDYAVDSEVPVDAFTIRRCGVQFGELTSHQKSRLEFFLNKHVHTPEQILDGSLAWEDHNFNSASHSARVANAFI